MSFDLFPTMLDMANIHYDDSKKKLDGASLVPLFKGKELSQRLLFWGNGNKTISVRDGKWKLVRYNQKGKITLHLFDLDNDPYEENNMSEQEPELVKRLDEQITRWAKSVYSGNTKSLSSVHPLMPPAIRPFLKCFCANR